MISRKEKMLKVAQAKLEFAQDTYYRAYPNDDSFARRVWFQVYCGNIRKVLILLTSDRDPKDEYVDIMYYHQLKDSSLKAMSQLRNIEYAIPVADHIVANWYYRLLTEDEYLQEEYDTLVKNKKTV